MTTTITARLDSGDKKQFEEICSSIGINPSTAINMFVKATLRENQIPFSLKADPFYSHENQNRLAKNIDEMEKTGGTIHKVNLDD